MAVIDVLEFTVKDAAADPKLTLVAPVNPFPVMVTDAPPPDVPADGETEVMDGNGYTYVN